MAVMATAIQKLVQERIGAPPIGTRQAVPLTTRIDPDTLKQLKKYAGALGVTPSMLARRLIEAGIDETEAEVRRLTAQRGKG